MTNGEAIKEVEEWLVKLDSPNEQESITAMTNVPTAAITRVVRQAKKAK